MRIETIGLPFGPAAFVGKPKKIKAIRLTMTCGGGMGGSSWDEYVLCEDGELDLQPETFIKVDTNLAKNKQINTRYIVNATPATIWKIEIKNLGNENCAQGISERYLDIDCDKLDTYNSYDNSDIYTNSRISWNI